MPISIGPRRQCACMPTPKLAAMKASPSHAGTNHSRAGGVAGPRGYVACWKANGGIGCRLRHRQMIEYFGRAHSGRGRKVALRVPAVMDLGFFRDPVLEPSSRDGERPEQPDNELQSLPLAPVIARPINTSLRLRCKTPVVKVALVTEDIPCYEIVL